ncbi:MAG: NUDIX domain-containing protein [Phycisphaerales bacterium]
MNARGPTLSGMQRSGPPIRTDAVDVYVFREFSADPSTSPQRAEFLQIRRKKEPAAGTWQTVMGGIEEGEKPLDAALRELHEEIGAGPDDLTGLWFLGQVYPFYQPMWDCIVLMPRFAARVRPDFEPTLNNEHDAHRWNTINLPANHDAVDALAAKYVWSSQRSCVREVVTDILARSGSEGVMRVG